MDLQTVYVGFGGHQVSVRSDVPEVIARIERGFREMLVYEPTITVGQLEVYRDRGNYKLLGRSEADEEFTSSSRLLKSLSTEVILKFISSCSRLLWFHAGAAAHRGSAVMILGPGGRGKSTLVTRLCSNGWTYLSDDAIPLDPDSDRAFPFPVTPAVREDLGREVPLEHLPDLMKTEMDLVPESVCREPMPIGALVFPNYSIGSPTRLSRCSPAAAALELLGNCLNPTSHREAAAYYLCDLVKRLPTFHLSYSSGSLAAELIARSHNHWHEIDHSGNVDPGRNWSW